MNAVEQDVYDRAHMALSEVGATWALMDAREAVGVPAVVILMDSALPIEAQWHARSLANMHLKSPRCLTCARDMFEQGQRGVPLLARSASDRCEAFGRFPLMDCGVPR